VGIANAHLIRAAEQARKKFGDKSKEYLKAAALVDQSQAECKHTEIRECMATKKGKNVEEGDMLRWCVLCAKPIAVNGIAWERLHPKKKH
jgi:hypothetical protein